ncbi:class I SAM-dependent methyltransferase [Paraburkholderia bonniea]|uniref:class I SAM-dependent methyltransferase n=1 Tax=Paraburkholderia bonniea TaxID=2152891 RepID=UPI00257394F5|nr:class I SAM-dependent methyltransferase [Paraburkholderia bonniea]WJF90111.1 class I SAM-dependent methyltransferase [Paraburkholderia bonniea]WJF93425.1 class I SAM-dependent methyltransferase [Paraburkholderia bonniea]
MAKYEFGASGELMLANDIRLNQQRPWLDRFPSGITTILDVGAGCGSHSKYFLEKGFKPTAVDVNDADFMFHDEIEFIKGNLNALPPERKFDAIFMSHVVEHFSNLERGINHLRSLLNEGGYLCVVVPPYEPIACDNHWQTGWNCGQLAMTLAACGFDCSDAVFVDDGKNVCGWGRIRPFEFDNQFTDSGFDIGLCREYLPAAMQASIFHSEAGNIHIPDLVLCDETVAARRLSRQFTTVPGFKLSDARVLTFDESVVHRELSIDFPEPLDLVNNVLHVIVLCEGEIVPLRIAVSSDSDGKYTNAGEYWLENNSGVACNEVNARSFKASAGNIDYRAIHKLSLGGASANCLAKIWIYLGQENLFLREKNRGVSSFSLNSDLSLASALQYFQLKDASELNFPEEAEYREKVIVFNQPVDFLQESVEIVTLSEGEQVNLRIALSASDDADFTGAAEQYLDNQSGLSICRINAHRLRESNPEIDLRAIRKISLGGTGKNSLAKIALRLGSTSAFELSRKNNMSVLTLKEDAVRASELFFYRNKALLLEQDNARMNAQLVEMAQVAQRSVETAVTEDLKSSLSQMQARLEQKTAELDLIAGMPYRVALEYRRLPIGVRRILRLILLPALSVAANIRKILKKAAGSAS